METDRELTPVYATNAQSQTLSGSSGNSFFTASATLATASVRTGQRIHVGASFHEYTVTSVSGTTLNVTPNLTQNYTNVGLRPEITTSVGGLDPYSAGMSQASDGSKPSYLRQFLNGHDVIEFPGGTKIMTVANYAALDDIFATGGTIAFVVGVNGAGGGSAGRICEKLNSGGTAIWNLVTTSVGGGFAALNFNYVTDATAGSFTTTTSVVALNIPQIIILDYDASDPTTPPNIHVIGVPVGVDVTTPPTGTASSDAGGALNIGNRQAGDRGGDFRFMAGYAWRRKLSEFERKKFERELAAKWAVTLYFDRTGTPLYAWGRLYLYAEPPAPVSNSDMIAFFHGGGGSAASFATALANAALFGDVLIRSYLDATYNNGDPPAKTWNSMNPPPSFNGAPDAKYIYDYIQWEISKGKVNPARIWAMGHSNGAMMIARLLCEYPTLFAGAFIVSGVCMAPNPNLFTGKLKCIHGADDANVPLAGGLGIGGVTYPAVLPTFQAFTAANSGGGVISGRDFVILEGAEHTLSSINNALIDDYETTLMDELYNFIFPA